jgi:CheY-like chemotaxis protein
MGARAVVLHPEAGSRQALHDVLSGGGFEVKVSSDGHQCLEDAARWQPDVVVVEVTEPSLAGTEALRKLRFDPRTRTASVVAVAPRGLPPEALERSVEGADDHVLEPLDAADVLATVRRTLGRARQQHEISPLTGMPGWFHLTAELAWLASRTEPRYAVLSADLHGFAAYNQRYGFERGDEAIRATGRLIAAGQAQHRVEPTFACHAGADHFVVVTAPSRAEALARWLVGGFDMLAPTLYDDPDRRRGYIEVLDRQAAARRHALVTIHVGVASTGRRPVPSHWEALDIAAEMRAVARQAGRSAYAVDRRRK